MGAAHESEFRCGDIVAIMGFTHDGDFRFGGFLTAGCTLSGYGHQPCKVSFAPRMSPQKTMKSL